MTIITSILIILFHGVLAGAFGLLLCGSFMLIERTVHRWVQKNHR